MTVTKLLSGLVLSSCFGCAIPPTVAPAAALPDVMVCAYELVGRADDGIAVIRMHCEVEE